MHVLLPSAPPEAKMRQAVGFRLRIAWSLTEGIMVREKVGRR